jgi:uncharacterized Zn-binding protein involved in type VI secretion
MSFPAARVTDMHTCPMVTPGLPPIPHVGGPILPTCSTNVLTGGLPQARVTDKCFCVGPVDMIVKGSSSVLVNNLPAARVTDTTTHGGVIISGQPNVLIGDSGGGGAGGGFGGMAAGGGADLATSASAMSKPGQQAAALREAAKNGTPFCEICNQ